MEVVKISCGLRGSINEIHFLGSISHWHFVEITYIFHLILYCLLSCLWQCYYILQPCYVTMLFLISWNYCWNINEYYYTKLKHLYSIFFSRKYFSTPMSYLKPIFLYNSCHWFLAWDVYRYYIVSIIFLA